MGALLVRIYKRFFWTSYDHIGKLLVVNLIWFVLFPVPTYLVFRLTPAGDLTRIVAACLAGLLTHAFASSGVFGITAAIAERKEIAIRHYFALGRYFYGRALALSFISGILVLLLFNSVRVYAGMRAGRGILGFFLAGVQLWILAFLLLMQVYLLPFLFARDRGVKQVLKWSAILVVLKPGFTVLIFVQALALVVLLAITGVGAVLLLYSTVSLFLSVTLHEVLRDLEATWQPKGKPTSWREIFEEADKDEEKRTLKDLFRPWET